MSKPIGFFIFYFKDLIYGHIHSLGKVLFFDNSSAWVSLHAPQLILELNPTTHVPGARLKPKQSSLRSGPKGVDSIWEVSNLRREQTPSPKS